MMDFLETHQYQLLTSLIVTILLFIIFRISSFVIKKIGKRNNINEHRADLMIRYMGFTLILIGLLIEGFVFGAELSDIGLVFSSVFAVIGIALFAIWSILSNITSGVIMFFSFPYKVGDKIQIHDKDFPFESVIEDIRAFHLHLRLDNGNLVTYPNNLMLQKGVTLVKKDAIDELY